VEADPRAVATTVSRPVRIFIPINRHINSATFLTTLPAEKEGIQIAGQRRDGEPWSRNVVWDSFSARATLLHRRDDAFLFPLNYLDGEIPRSSICRDSSLRTAAFNGTHSASRCRREETRPSFLAFSFHSMLLYFPFVRGERVARGLPLVALAARSAASDAAYVHGNREMHPALGMRARAFIRFRDKTLPRESRAGWSPLLSEETLTGTMRQKILEEERGDSWTAPRREPPQSAPFRRGRLSRVACSPQIPLLIGPRVE